MLDPNAREKLQPILQVDERGLARELFQADAILARPVRSELGLSEQANVHFDISTQDLDLGRVSPGDIDVLLAERSIPEQAIALECKRLKVAQHSFGSGLLSGSGRLSTGVRQANGLRRLGFWKSYLCLLVAVDAREQPIGERMFSYLTPELLDALYRFPERERLDPGVGLLVCEFTHSSTDSEHLANMIGIERIAPAHSQPQSSSVTKLARSIWPDSTDAPGSS